jgi:hypothetical protein
MKVNTYAELLERLHSSKPNPYYYEILATNFELLLRQFYITNQGRVAKDLRMSTSKLSNYTVMFKELIRHNATISYYNEDDALIMELCDA